MKRLKTALERAALLRYLSRVLQPPDEEQAKELRELAGTLPVPLQDEAKGLSHGYHEDLIYLYHLVLGPTGAVRDCESDYVGDPIGGKGPVLADISGFYRAFSFDPSIELRTSPDHISAELGFLSFLSFKEAYALYNGDEERVAICVQASEWFWREHLGTWIDRLAESVHEAAAGTFYSLTLDFALRALRRDAELEEAVNGA